MSAQLQIDTDTRGLAIQQESRIGPKSRRVYFHVHIPKCGGSTFLEVLQQNFGWGFHRDDGLLTDYQYSSEQVDKILRAHQWLRCYSSHKLSLELPYCFPGIDLYSIAFIRDPVDRFISHYFFHRHYSAVYVPEAKKLDLSDYIEFALTEGNQPMYIGGQTRFLSGSPDEKGLTHIEKLLIKGNTMLFPLSRFDEACLFLEKSYPDDFRDCSYVIRNISTKDQSISVEHRQKIADYGGSDTTLLDMSNRFLDNKLALYYDKESLIQEKNEFYRRCQRRRNVERIKGPAKSFARKLYKIIS